MNRQQVMQSQAMLKALQTWWEKIPTTQGFAMVSDQAYQPVRSEQARAANFDSGPDATRTIRTRKLCR